MRRKLPPGPARWERPERRLLENPERSLLEWGDRFGDVFTIPMPGLRRRSCPVVIIGKPEALRSLFRSERGLWCVADSRERLRRIVGDHCLFMLDGEAHLARKRMLLPLFHGAALRRHRDAMAEITDRNVDRWPLGQPFSLAASMANIASEIVMRALLGIADPEHVALMLRLVDSVIQPWTGPGLPKRELTRKRTKLDELLNAEIARRQVSKSPHADVLSLLVQAVDERGRQLGHDELHGELMTLMFAAHETTAVALEWLFEYLLRDAARLERASVEARGEATPFIDAVVKESLRLRPPVPIVTRTLLQPRSVDGYDLPPGTIVAPCLFLANRAPEFHPAPGEFLPERFLEGNPDTYTWLPFGAGARRCLGAAWAEFEMRIVVQRILARTELELLDPAPEFGKWRFIAVGPGQTRAIMQRRDDAAVC